MKNTIFIAISAITILSVVTPIFLASVSNSDYTVEKETKINKLGLKSTSEFTYSYELEEAEKDSWELISLGQKATEKGEVYTFAIRKSYNNSLYGTIGGDVKNIESALDCDFDKSYLFITEKSTKELEKGEYTNAYWTKNYKVVPITTTEKIHVYGWEIKDGKRLPVDYYEYKTYDAIAKIARLPNILI